MPSLPLRPLRSRWLWLGLVGVGFALMGACETNSPNPDTLGGNGGLDATTGSSSGGNGCTAGKQGCPCDVPGQRVSCGVLVSKNGSYVTCTEGTAVCDNGSWGACMGTTVQKSVRPETIGADGQLTSELPPGKTLEGTTITTGDGGTCPVDPCDPNQCSQTSDNGGDVPKDAAVLITEAGVTLYPTTSEGGGGGGTQCTGLQCQVDWSCASNSQTTITGTVYDPAMQNPLYNAYVYIPIDPNPSNLPAFSSGASCNSCSGVTLNAVAVAQTDVHGNFTLKNVPTTALAPNNPIPLVVQMGKWRRVQMLTTVADCKSTAIPTANSRLPKNQFDGYNNHADIPRMAIATGSADPFECMMLRMGIDPAEFQVPGTGSRRIDYYVANGQQFQGGNAPGYSNLVGSVASLTPYDVILLPCEGNQDEGNENYSDFVASYTMQGGRMFTTHYGYTWLADPSGSTANATNPVTGVANPFYPVGTWNFDYQYNSANGQIDTGFPKGLAFEQWMDGLPAPNNGTVTNGLFTVAAPRNDFSAVNPAYATQWMHDTTNNVPWPLHMTFNTPMGAGIGDAGADGGAQVCGRVVYSDFHVTNSAFVNGGGCNSNADCGYGSTCNTTTTYGTCTTQACDPLTVAATCGDSAFTCTGGTAGTCSKSGTQCYLTTDCHGGKKDKCGGQILGTCQPNTCTTDAQCNSPEHCVGGACGGCAQDSDCPGPNQTCQGYTPAGQCTGNSNQFPNSCAQGPLDAQESALEFMLLDLTACVQPDNQQPSPPSLPVTAYAPQTFALDFTSSCPSGTHVRWLELDYADQIPAAELDGATPSGASIVFNAQTADAPADGGAINWSTPQKVLLATSTVSTTTGKTYIDTSPGADGGPGGGAFNLATPAVQSKSVLHLLITINPSSGKDEAPVLNSWAIKSDCPPSE